MTEDTTTATVWTLERALNLVRCLQPAFMHDGWCIMLGGGVLNRGFGKDLDLLAYPMSRHTSIEAALLWLPLGTWSAVPTAKVYSFHVEELPVELIFQDYVHLMPLSAGLQNASLECETQEYISLPIPDDEFQVRVEAVASMCDLDVADIKNKRSRLPTQWE